MKYCAFGTARMDIRIFDRLMEFDVYDEIKVDKMSIGLGGSVYYTVNMLTRLKQEVVFYMLNSCDEMSDYIIAKMKQQEINYISSQEDSNKTAATIIFLDENGQKKMVSCDGERMDRYILHKLNMDIKQYDVFYTAFYEINSENYTDILNIMNQVKYSIIDLSPLIYKISNNIISDVLKHTYILSGTRDEYDILLRKLNLSSIEDLIEKYKIKIAAVKKGDKGAELYFDNKIKAYAPKEKRNVSDTTGCGDTFNAGILYSMDMGFDYEKMLKISVDMATAVAYNGFFSQSVTDAAQAYTH